MTGRTHVVAIAIVVVVAAPAVGFLVWKSLEDAAAVSQAEAPALGGAVLTAGAARPDFELPDVEGTMRSVREWDGKVLVVNFWATWCPPCREEIPAFIELQDEYAARGLQFVGIAIDQLTVVQGYAAAMGVNYPILVGELDAIELGKQYGNRLGAVPYTVIVDRQGRMAFRKQGEFKREEAEKVILSLL